MYFIGSFKKIKRHLRYIVSFIGVPVRKVFHFKRRRRIFVDDTKIYARVNKLDDRQILQTDSDPFC